MKLITLVFSLNAFCSLSLAEGGRFGLSSYYSLADTFHFYDISATISGTTYKGSFTYNSEPAFGIAAFYSDLAPNSWGYISSVMYELPRSIKNIKLSSGGSNIVFNSTTKVAFIIFEGTLAYRWENFYVQAGPNFNFPKVDDGGSLQSDASGGIGVRAGVGMFVNENNSFEASLRSLMIKSTGRDGADIYDFGSGSFEGIALTYKYWL